MDSEPKSEKIQNDVSKEKKPEHDNSNINENEKENKNANDLNKDSQILDLKKEILLLKNQQIQSDSKIKEISNNFQKEIDSLKKQVKNLISELNQLKSKKKPKDNIDNINNINNENNDDSDEIMDDDQSYSIECLTKRLNIEILQGAEKANIDIMVRNNSMKKYTPNSYLICDSKNSLLLCEKVKLNELESRQQQNINIVFKNLKYISKGKYRCIIKLEIDKKVYNSFFEITVEVLPNKNIQNFQQRNYQNNFVYPKEIMPGGNIGNINIEQLPRNIDIDEAVYQFRELYSLYNNDSITDEQIKEALKKNNFNSVKAFESLYQ